MAKIAVDVKTTRLNALKASCALFCVGMLLFLRQKESFPLFFWLSAGLCFSALFFPRLAGQLFSLAALAVKGLGVCVLALFYFLVLTPWGLVYRVASGKSGRKRSYWEEAGQEADGQYERQY